jgi:pyrophosphatase PpaX
MRTIRTVLFDLDGTILDTNELILRSFEHVWERLGYRNLTREQLYPHMGGKLTEMFGATTGAGEADMEEMIRLYREYNFAHHDELVRAFPHVDEVLAGLRRAGIRIGVVTTKIRKTTEMGLKLCKLDGYIETLVTLDDVSQAKPHPEPVLTALKRMGAAKEETLMVGDSAGDLISARDAGVRSVLVSWTLKNLEELKRHEPDYVIDDIRELLAIVGLAGDGR